MVQRRKYRRQEELNRSKQDVLLCQKVNVTIRCASTTFVVFNAPFCMGTGFISSHSAQKFSLPRQCFNKRHTWRVRIIFLILCMRVHFHLSDNHFYQIKQLCCYNWRHFSPPMFLFLKNSLATLVTFCAKVSDCRALRMADLTTAGYTS